MNDRPVRPVRTVRSEPIQDHRRPLTPGEIDSLDEGYRTVISGIVAIDVGRAHAELNAQLHEKDPTSPSGLLYALNHVQKRFMDSVRLAAKARREYELFKASDEEWWESKKTAALVALEEEKKEKELKKQITIDMIRDRVRATWPEEVRQREQKLRDFQAAVHEIEKLPDAFEARAQSLAKMDGIVQRMGLSQQGDYSPRNR